MYTIKGVLELEIIFKDGIIQKGGRIKVPKAIIDTLGLREGQQVTVKFDSERKKMIVEFERGGKNAK